MPYAGLYELVPVYSSCPVWAVRAANELAELEEVDLSAFIADLVVEYARARGYSPETIADLIQQDSAD